MAHYRMLKSKVYLYLICLIALFGQPVFAQQDTIKSMELGSQPYILAPGDVVSVTVFGEPDVSSNQIRVPLTGAYNYPLIGEIKLGGETLESLADLIQSKLKAGFLSDPKVSVNIVHYRPVIVSGAVNESGIVKYQEGMTVQILSALSGVKLKQTDLDKVTIRRKNQEFNPRHLNDLIQPGDIVTYEAPSYSEDYYYIFGEVNRPGRYVYEDGITMEKAIIVAGGYTPFAAKRKIMVRRNEANKAVKMKLNESILLGDVITVKKRWF